MTLLVTLLVHFLGFKTSLKTESFRGKVGRFRRRTSVNQGKRSYVRLVFLWLRCFAPCSARLAVPKYRLFTPLSCHESSLRWTTQVAQARSCRSRKSSPGTPGVQPTRKPIRQMAAQCPLVSARHVIAWRDVTGLCGRHAHGSRVWSLGAAPGEQPAQGRRPPPCTRPLGVGHGMWTRAKSRTTRTAKCVMRPSLCRTTRFQRFSRDRRSSGGPFRELFCKSH